MIVGRAAPGEGPGRIIAESIAGVDRKTYLDRLAKRGESTLPIALQLIGAALVIWAAFDARRLWRDPRGKLAEGQYVGG